MANTKVQSEQIANDAVVTSHIADNVGLGGSPTTTTQSASDNSTKIATTAYVDAAFTALVDSSPAALNTLNELAAALGDDANFSTTVTNSIATKLPLAGGTMTGNLNSTADIVLTKTGTDDAGIKFATANANRYIASDENGVVSIGTGTTLTGGTQYLTIDSGKVGIGTASPSALLHLSGADPIIKFTDTAGGDDFGIFASASDFLGFHNFSDSRTDMVINGSGNVGIGTSSPSSIFHVVAEGNNGQRIHVGTSSAHQIYLGNTGGVSSVGTLSNHNFQVITNGSSRLLVDSSGRVIVGRTNDFSSLGYKFQVDFGTTTTGILVASANTASKVALDMRDKNNSGAAGTITYDGLTAQYNTSSDYRLKENIQPLENGLDRLKNLKPVKFNWKENGKTNEGFIAHEVQEIFSDAVTGEKDGEDMQGMDYGRITPLLVKAIQEQQTIIEDLKTRIETLEG